MLQKTAAFFLVLQLIACGAPKPMPHEDQLELELAATKAIVEQSTLIDARYFDEQLLVLSGDRIWFNVTTDSPQSFTLSRYLGEEGLSARALVSSSPYEDYPIGIELENQRFLYLSEDGERAKRSPARIWRLSSGQLLKSHYSLTLHSSEDDKLLKEFGRPPYDCCMGTISRDGTRRAGVKRGSKQSQIVVAETLSNLPLRTLIAAPKEVVEIIGTEEDAKLWAMGCNSWLDEKEEKCKQRSFVRWTLPQEPLLDAATSPSIAPDFHYEIDAESNPYITVLPLGDALLFGDSLDPGPIFKVSEAGIAPLIEAPLELIITSPKADWLLAKHSDDDRNQYRRYDHKGQELDVLTTPIDIHWASPTALYGAHKRAFWRLDIDSGREEKLLDTCPSSIFIRDDGWLFGIDPTLWSFSPSGEFNEILDAEQLREQKVDIEIDDAQISLGDSIILSTLSSARQLSFEGEFIQGQGGLVDGDIELVGDTLMVTWLEDGPGAYVDDRDPWITLWDMNLGIPFVTEKLGASNYEFVDKALSAEGIAILEVMTFQIYAEPGYIAKVSSEGAEIFDFELTGDDLSSCRLATSAHQIACVVSDQLMLWHINYSKAPGIEFVATKTIDISAVKDSKVQIIAVIDEDHLLFEAEDDLFEWRNGHLKRLRFGRYGGFQSEEIY